MTKVGVIGFGLSATVFHLPLIAASRRFQLVAISSSQVDRVRSEYPGVQVFASAETLITDSEAELVIITAPNDAHFSLASLCLEKGRHVVLEKPMVVTGREGDKLVYLANEKSRKLSVYHNRRWDGDFLTVKKLIDNNAFGDIRYFESHFDRFRPEMKHRWRELPGPGVGTWYDLGSHLLDQALVLFGTPRALTARCLALRFNSEVTDYFHVMLHYPDKEVILHSSPYSAGPNCRFHIQGNKGSYIKSGLDPQELQLKNGLVPDSPGFGLEAEKNFGTLYQDSGRERIKTEAGRYLSYYESLAMAIEQDEPVPVSSEEAARVIKLIQLAEQSSREGKTVELGW